ncbi:hypothetical protein [Desulfonatronum parangueonense]
MVAHFRDDPFDRGSGAFQFLLDQEAGDALSVRAKQPVQGVEAEYAVDDSLLGVEVEGCGICAVPLSVDTCINAVFSSADDERLHSRLPKYNPLAGNAADAQSDDLYPHPCHIRYILNVMMACAG